MNVEQITALLEPFLQEVLSRQQHEQVSAYLDLLLKWNSKMNLTAVRKPEEIIARHFGESFFAAQKLLDAQVHSVIDLGSGAGFPGLPMAIYSPLTKVILIESQNKKATFLKEVVRTLGLRNVEVFAGRGEDYPGKADLVTLRAVEKFELAIRAAAGLVKPGGRVGLMIGGNQQGALPSTFKWEPVVIVPGAAKRILATGRRIEEPRE